MQLGSRGGVLTLEFGIISNLGHASSHLVDSGCHVFKCIGLEYVSLYRITLLWRKYRFQIWSVDICGMI